MYYSIVMVAVLMFSLQFFFNQRFEKECGSSLRSSIVFSLGFNIVGFIVLLIINCFKLEYTLFTLIMAVLTALNLLAYTFCSMKALGKINLSLYSVFAMLGGMTLPFITGILFYNETITPGKLICFILVAAALFLTVNKENNTGSKIYYIGIFILNGMAGVLSKIFQAADFEKTSNAGYSVLSAAAGAIISLIILLFIGGEKIRLTFKSTAYIFGYGILNKLGNYLLLIALGFLPASAQYPMVTGGVMIFSTIICFFTDKKPAINEIISVLLSFAGIMCLVLIT